ncbi:MAG: SMP-30/gluconolactonase/LRE family protein [Deltaproteobacteria bacterium]|nr:SMP-30/gluconolactonase/LRE family protein [Deltaproteobacteria bacterium]MBM4298197.1 SMP-30/gluconolactonase/LRE family protein [Deltaproteobacteria bacterium]
MIDVGSVRFPMQRSRNQHGNNQPCVDPGLRRGDGGVGPSLRRRPESRWRRALYRKAALTIASILFWFAVVQAQNQKVSILIDLDPNSAERSVIVESIAADNRGRLYTADRVSGNVWRIDPKNPRLVVVGRVVEREIDGKKIRADVSGITFNSAGDLYLTAGGFKEVLRIRAKELNPDKPGVAQTFATQTENANGLAFDKAGRLYVSGGRNGKIYRTGPEGGKADVVVQIPPHVRTLPDGNTQQALTANGLAFDASGTVLYIADTTRGAIWRSTITNDGTAGPPQSVVQSALLEGADGPAFDRHGNLWVAANERNAVVVVTPEGRVYDALKNNSKGPLEFPTSVVIVDNTVYVSNFDTPRRDNLAADGKTSIDGIGASIVKIEP